MSSNEDEASETSRPYDESIELLDHQLVKYLDINICLDDFDTDQSIAVVEVALYDEDCSEIVRFSYTLSDPAEWERLSNAIGRCSSIWQVDMIFKEGQIDQVDALNPQVYQCIETLYRGLEANSSIESLNIDMDLFPNSGVFPILNLNGAQFKENLVFLSLSSEIPIEINRSLMILPFLESTSLESFSISDCNFANEAAVFRRIVSACTRVQRLDVSSTDLNTNEWATSIASLFRDQRSILTEFNVFNSLSTISLENLAILVDGLTSNTTIKMLRLNTYCPSPSECSEFERLLCNASSIEGIHNSNHTLEELDYRLLPRFIMNCLELNKDTNKDKVIRTKIARYYFRGEFDIAPFVNMNIKLLPQVMAMVEGDLANQRDVIYRLLRSIPDLCTFSSGLSRKRKNNVL